MKKYNRCKYCGKFMKKNRQLFCDKCIIDINKIYLYEVMGTTIINNRKILKAKF